MSDLDKMLLGALADQEDWLATLTPSQQSQARIQMALLEIAIRKQYE